MGRENADIYLGLVHNPVYNKRGKTITTTVTNMDLHDIARAGKTYNVNRYFVINPLKSQQALVRRMKKYWSSEYGAEYNSNRQEAFSVLEIADNLTEVVNVIKNQTGRKPQLIASSARPSDDNISYMKLRDIIHNSDDPFLILFGTGWGLTREVMDSCDYMLAPIYGRGDFNHLSVRSAASIILDRLLAGNWWE